MPSPLKSLDNQLADGGAPGSVYTAVTTLIASYEGEATAHAAHIHRRDTLREQQISAQQLHQLAISVEHDLAALEYWQHLSNVPLGAHADAVQLDICDTARFSEMDGEATEYAQPPIPASDPGLDL
ncbi:hypothetical protein [Nocardia abscessus]|uniref:hypothetical protein n=1 Tax=Nocardia abscessus TaxID=120957 RepID=UPI0024547747|nr:hypothetical protein [Nocardia abscessus]